MNKAVLSNLTIEAKLNDLSVDEVAGLMNMTYEEVKKLIPRSKKRRSKLDTISRELNNALQQLPVPEG
jgi:hypothetical protein